MTTAAGLLADLRGVIRIAKAASLGVTGNASRIARAEKAVDAVAGLVEASGKGVLGRDGGLFLSRNEAATLRAALARFGGAP